MDSIGPLINILLKSHPAMLGKPIESLKIITCHLGNGSSIAAVDGENPVNTSMGFTPLEDFTYGSQKWKLGSLYTWLYDGEEKFVL